MVCTDSQWYRLKCAGLSDSNIRKLFNVTKDYNEISNISSEQLIGYLKFSDSDLQCLKKAKSIDLQEEIKNLKAKEVSVIFIEDEVYPEKLKNIAMPPLFLYYRGDISLLNKFSIGVVGTRKATSYGRGVCEKITSGLVDAGIVTISGLALGIDGICHKKTLEKKGETIAVVGSGLDYPYPKENLNLWDKIGKEGLLLSEYPLGAQPQNYHFPMRNRIIVGLARGIVVVESKASGGSLITAELALEEGRDIFAVPGEVFSETSQGCNNLIKNSQAKLIVDVKDVLDEYGISISSNTNGPKIALTFNEQKIYDTVKGLVTVDEIYEVVGMKTSEILAILIDLEMKDLIVATPGGGYRRK